MFGKLLKRFVAGKSRPFNAWQVELTTRCPLSCAMCIRKGPGEWKNQDMPIDRFKRLAGYFRDVEVVILQGWGEPLLYPHLPEAIAAVKKQGARAGFVTSGYGLDLHRSMQLLGTGVDFIGFSLAGASAATHNSIRVNSDFNTLVRSIEEFQSLGKARGGKRPALHIAYLLLRENIAELSELVDLAGELSIEQVFVINLIHVTTTAQDDSKVFTCYEENPLEHLVAEAVEKAKRVGIRLQVPSLTASEVVVCEENPLKNLYITAGGQVTPCVYLCPPCGSPIHRIFCGSPVDVEAVGFGNVFSTPFEDIWADIPYEDFRERLRRRVAWNATATSLPSEELPLPPGPCRTCHKMVGL